MSDIIDLAKDVGRDDFSCDNVGFAGKVKGIRPMREIRSRYYVRFQAIDRPGVLASISGVLAEYKISISSVKQVARSSQKMVPIIMLTHEASERSMAAALKKINSLSCISSKSVAIRIENL